MVHSGTQTRRSAVGASALPSRSQPAVLHPSVLWRSSPWLVGIAATLVTAIAMGRPSLWYDEAATVAAAARTPAQLWQLLGNVDAVHGLYYLAMHAWISAFGESAFALRAPSAIGVGIAAAGVFVLTRHWADQRTALVAAIAFVLLPRVAWMGIEARSTSLTVALAVWTTYLLVRALRPDARGGWWVGYAAAAGFGIAFNIYLVTLLLAHAVTLVWLRTRARAWIRWLVASGAAVLVAAPVIIESRQQSAQLGGVELPVQQMLRSVAVNQWFLGATPNHTGDGGPGQGSLGAQDVAGSPWLVAALVLAAVCWMLVLYGLWRGYRPQQAAQGWVRRAVPWLVPWLVVPSLAAVAYSALVSPMYNQRYLAFSAPALAILVAAGFTAIRARTLRGLVAGVVIVASLTVFVSQRTPHAKSGYDWAQAAHFVAASRAADQGVYFAPRNPTTGETLKTARMAALAYPSAFAGLRDVTLVAPVADSGTLAGWSAPLAGSEQNLAGLQGVWVIRWNDYPPEAAAADDSVLADAGFVPTNTKWQGNNTDVVLYVSSVL